MAADKTRRRLDSTPALRAILQLLIRVRVDLTLLAGARRLGAAVVVQGSAGSGMLMMKEWMDVWMCLALGVGLESFEAHDIRGFDMERYRRQIEQRGWSWSSRLARVEGCGGQVVEHRRSQTRADSVMEYGRRRFGAGAGQTPLYAVPALSGASDARPTLPEGRVDWPSSDTLSVISGFQTDQS
ncbi:hypothetical protein B0H19DRAFT_1058473 [Mycena capillaripes]|nr:hypothetical protein B0H19DRAFT_1058473 [Mycena capillaripes]